MTLRIALAISALIHSVFLMPIARQDNTLPKPRVDTPIEVEYVTLKEQKVPDNIKAKILPRAKETPSVELKDKVETTPEDKDAAEQAKKESQLKKTKDYVNYYQLIREKVRSRLKNNYTSRDREGDVSMVFILGSGGELQSARIDRSRSTGDSLLLDVANRSLREASPFPRFPKGLSVPSMSFNLLVSFKKE